MDQFSWLRRRSLAAVYLWMIVILLPAAAMTGCGIQEEKKVKVRDMDFTVVEETQINEELMEIITERKENPFQLSYAADQELYLVIGYGEQQTGGYSITVDELYAAKDAVCIRTTLQGPAKDEKVKQTPTWPYIVVKTEFIDLPVIYQ